MWKSDNNIFLYISCLLIALLVIAREILMIGVNGPMICAAIAILLFCIPYKDAISFLYFILPLTCGIPGYSMLLAYVILFFRTKAKSLQQFLPAIILILSEILHSGLYDFTVEYAGIISFSSFVSVFFLVWFIRDPRVDFISCVKSFCVSAIFACMVVVVKLSILYGYDALIAGELRGGVMLYADEMLQGQMDLNANSMALYSITVMSCLLLGPKQLQMSKAVYVLLLALALVAGMLSFSRTWILSVAVMIFLFLMYKKLNIGVVIAIACCMMALMLLPDFNQYTEIITGRFDDETMSSAGERSGIFQYYTNWFLEHPKYWMFGTGAVYYSDVVKHTFSMHNALQQILVCCGCVGFIVMSICLWFFYKTVKRANLPFLFYIPFLVVGLFYQSVQFLVPYYLMYPIIVTFAILRMRVNENR